MSDISNGNWSTTDGSNTAAPPNGWPTGMAPNTVEATAQAGMGATKRWWERANAGISTTGSAGAYVLTPTNVSYPTAYTQGEVYGAKANFTSVGNDTLNVNGLGAKKIYIQGASGPTAITAGAIVSAQQFLVSYDSALNAAAGGFQLLSAPSTATVTVVSGNVGAVNGKMLVTSASATATFTADEITTETALAGTAYKLASYSQAVNLATTGAGGMDTGAAPASGFVSVYAINKADGTTSILACNVTTSSAEIYGGGSMPSGYVASALLGIVKTNGSSQIIISCLLGRKYSWVGTSALVAGNATSLTSVSLTAVPTTARFVDLYCSFSATPAATQTGAVIRSGNTSSYPGITLALSGAAASPILGGLTQTLPLMTAQTVWYSITTGSTLTMDVLAYTF